MESASLLFENWFSAKADISMLFFLLQPLIREMLMYNSVSCTFRISFRTVLKYTLDDEEKS